MENNKPGKYFVQQFLQEEYLHGGVGGTDAEKILKAKGFSPVLFPGHDSFSFRTKIKRLFFLFKTLQGIKEGDVIIFLFPVYALVNRLLLNRLARRKDIKIICFIADINGLKDGYPAILREEIRFFRQFGHFIVHNDNMKEWVLKSVAPRVRISTIEFFDFLVKPTERIPEPSFEIVFAGNLQKSPFIDQLHLLQKTNPSLKFLLYGHREAEYLNQENASWLGVEKPYELPAKLRGSFGLLWDGDSIDKPAGSLGDYMQYISHHKLSLYIISKLPVIVPESGAAAALVKKYNIGFTINSLYDIEEKVKALSPDEYRQMQNNMQPLAKKISEGECLGGAVDELLAS